MNRILKPELWKILLTPVLLVVASFFGLYIHTFDVFPLGVPFTFFIAWGPCQLGHNCSEANWLFLVLDILIWYFVSAVLIHWIKNYIG